MVSIEISLPILGATCWFEGDGEAPDCPGFPERMTGKPALEFLEPMQRRRLSRLARGVFHCANRVWPEGKARVVFASRHGESERTLSILQDIASGVEVSPLHFSMAVHNAVPGLLSILKGNRAPATALAAGSESFGYGLLEAFGAWKTDPSEPVLYLFGEDRIPELWGPFTEAQAPHAVALLIGEGGRELRMRRDPSGRGPEPEFVQSVHFLVSAGSSGAPAPWTGPTAAWDWHLA